MVAGFENYHSAGSKIHVSCYILTGWHTSNDIRVEIVNFCTKLSETGEHQRFTGRRAMMEGKSEVIYIVKEELFNVELVQKNNKSIIL